MANSRWPEISKNDIIRNIRDRERHLQAIEDSRKAAITTVISFGAAALASSVGAVILNHWFLYFLAIITIVALIGFGLLSVPVTQRYSKDRIRYEGEKERFESELHELKYGDKND